MNTQELIRDIDAGLDVTLITHWNSNEDRLTFFSRYWLQKPYTMIFNGGPIFYWTAQEFLNFLKSPFFTKRQVIKALKHKPACFGDDHPKRKDATEL